MYQTLSPTFRSLKESLDIAIDSKEDNITKFNVDLEKMLNDLLSEISDIRNAAQDPMVLSPSSNSDDVIKYLEELRIQLEKVDVLKRKYETWGRLFRNGGLTRIISSDNDDGAHDGQPESNPDGNIEMVETTKEVELKNSLWTSLREWDKLVEYAYQLILDLGKSNRLIP